MTKGSPSEAEQLSQETAFQLLGHSYRLALLDCLEYYGEPITLADAAEWVASTLEQESLKNIDEETVKRIYMSLYHSHIPRLQEHGIIEYHQKEDMVVPGDADQLKPYLDLVESGST